MVDTGAEAGSGHIAAAGVHGDLCGLGNRDGQVEPAAVVAV